MWFQDFGTTVTLNEDIFSGDQNIESQQTFITGSPRWNQKQLAGSNTSNSKKIDNVAFGDIWESFKDPVAQFTTSISVVLLAKMYTVHCYLLID